MWERGSSPPSDTASDQANRYRARTISPHFPTATLRAVRPRRRKIHRPAIDPAARRYFIYYLYAADGICLYVGRSCEVSARLRSHLDTKAWFTDVRRVSLEGPFTWDEAVKVESTAIKRDRPVHNIVSHPDHWPIGRRAAV